MKSSHVAIKRHNVLEIKVVATESHSFAWVSMGLPLSSKELCISIAQDVAGCRYGRDEKGDEGNRQVSQGERQ
jgi:hypothetical protein